MTSIDYMAYEDLQKEIENLSKMKNADYGCNSLVEFGNMGILIRLSDKFDRMKSLYKQKKEHEPNVVDEKIEDTLKDIVNYSMYMILQERGKLIKNAK